MNYIEQEIANLERMIKKIEEHPDPNRLKSNKQGYEIQRDMRMGQIEDWKEGKPVLSIIEFQSLARAMGFSVIDGTALANRRSARHPEDTLASLHDLRSRGFPTNCCDGPLVGLGMRISGQLPPPNLAMAWGACDPATMTSLALAEYYDIPIFYYDCPQVDRVDNDVLEYLTNQILEFIEFAEAKVPGVKFDEEKLAELQEVDALAFPYFQENYELRKRVPCPLPARDAFRIPIAPSRFPDPQKALEYIIASTAELKERAETKTSSIADEKLRLGWTVTAPLYRNVFKQCEERGVAIPIIITGLTAKTFMTKYTLENDGIKEYGRKLSPLEKEVIKAAYTTWWGVGTRWLEDVIDICRDLKVDGLLNFLQMGCTPTLGLKKLIEDKAEKELNIQTIHLEGAYHDSEYMNDELFDAQLNDFIDICLSRKESAM
ncbi:2-hydroxyacyl-CoA dehydratase [Thermodesulfobacteriota bacterium]